MNHKLNAFMFLLLRDNLSAGQVGLLLREAEEMAKHEGNYEFDASFSERLYELAKEAAERLEQ